jgi:hypothetical protein
MNCYFLSDLECYLKIDGKYVLIKKGNKPIIKRELTKAEYQKLFNILWEVA